MPLGPIAGGVDPGAPTGARIGRPSEPMIGAAVPGAAGKPLGPTGGSRFGGSAETHEKMTETLVKTFEELKTRGKKIEEVEHHELAEIVQKSTPR